MRSVYARLSVKTVLDMSRDDFESKDRWKDIDFIMIDVFRFTREGALETSIELKEAENTYWTVIHAILFGNLHLKVVWTMPAYVEGVVDPKYYTEALGQICDAIDAHGMSYIEMNVYSLQCLCSTDNKWKMLLAGGLSGILVNVSHNYCDYSVDHQKAIMKWSKEGFVSFVLGQQWLSSKQVVSGQDMGKFCMALFNYTPFDRRILLEFRAIGICDKVGTTSDHNVQIISRREVINRLGLQKMAIKYDISLGQFSAAWLDDKTILHYQSTQFNVPHVIENTKKYCKGYIVSDIGSDVAHNHPDNLIKAIRSNF